MIAGSRATTETLPLSLTLIAIVGVIAIALNRPESQPGGKGRSARLEQGSGADPADLARPTGEPTDEEEIRLRRHAALLLLRLADPALAARVEGTVDPAVTLAPSDLGRLNELLRRAGFSPGEFLLEQRRLAQNPAWRAGLLAIPHWSQKRD